MPGGQAQSWEVTHPCSARLVPSPDSLKAGPVFIPLSNVWVSVELEKLTERRVSLGGVPDPLEAAIPQKFRQIPSHLRK